MPDDRVPVQKRRQRHLVHVPALLNHSSIRDFRRRLGLTQDQLGRMLGVHAMTVSKWERGTTAPTHYNMQQLHLAELGSRDLDKVAYGKLHEWLALGLSVVALAFLVDRGQRRAKGAT